MKDDTETLVGLALIAAAVWVGYEIWKGLKAGGAAVGAAQSAAGSAVADLFPNNVVTPGSGQTFTVTMADGSTQQVVAGQLPVPSSQYVAPLDTSLDAGTDTGTGMMGL